MAIISITANTFDPENTTQVVIEENVISIADWAARREENFAEDPWICVLRRGDKTYYPLRCEWDEEIQEGDKLHFLPHVADPISIIIAIIVVIVVVLIFLFLSIPAMTDPQGTPDPVSSIDGRRNKARLNSPIEDAYGRNKLWATYLAQPYVRYEGNNKQILYQVLTLGQGEFDIENVLIEDTPADNFSEIQYWFDNVEVFDNNVSVCQEARDINLLGTNQEDYPGAIGPFAVNPPNTVCEYLEIDFSLPGGAYDVDDEGDVRSVGIKVLWEAREINAAGLPINPGEWYRVFLLNRRYATNQPQRVTVGRNMPREGRWEIRCIRQDEAFLDVTGTDKVQWDYARGVRGNFSQPALGTINIKTRASTNTVSNKINVLATRKLAVWDGAAWLAPAASRNPIWAMVNILKSSWGGQLTDDDLDLPALKLAADQADAALETFDWVFDTKTTVWDACRLCCQVCRSAPLLQGSKISVLRDVGSSVPVMLFNSSNIVQNSLKIKRKVYDTEGKDGLEATYFDQVTWKDETVTATLEQQTALNPKKTQLRGVTNRDQAQKLANYMWASEFYNRENITFKTTHAGFSATYNDLIKVETDIMRWGQGGDVLNITGGGEITLSEPPTFESGVDHNINFRTKTGGFYGPFLVDPVAGLGNENKVQIRGGTVITTDLPISDDHEKPAYIFGPLDFDGKLCRIAKVVNSGIDEIEITATIENYGRFSNDLVPSPPIIYPPVQPKAIVNPTEEIQVISIARFPYGDPGWRITFRALQEDGDSPSADYAFSFDGGNSYEPYTYTSGGTFTTTVTTWTGQEFDAGEIIPIGTTEASLRNEIIIKTNTYYARVVNREVLLVNGVNTWVFATWPLYATIQPDVEGWIRLTTDTDSGVGNELLGMSSAEGVGLSADDTPQPIQ